MILFKFLFQFSSSPDSTVELKNPSADAISDNKIEMEVVEEEEPEKEKEKDVLAQYDKYVNENTLLTTLKLIEEEKILINKPGKATTLSSKGPPLG